MEFKHFTRKEIENGKDIPPDLYPNIFPTMIILDEIREWYGKPIYINSSYRSPEYNHAIGGSSKSLHLEFNAIDFTILFKLDLLKIYTHLHNLDLKHHFKHLPRPGCMGLGLYKNFIHLDTRGLLNRPAPSRWKQ